MLAIRLLSLPGAFFLSFTCFAGNIELGSPDGNIRVIVRPTDSFPVYSVFYKGTMLVDASPLNLVFREPRAAAFFGPGLLVHSSTRAGTDSYTLPVGRNKIVNDRYNESSITLQEPHR